MFRKAKSTPLKTIFLSWVKKFRHNKIDDPESSSKLLLSHVLNRKMITNGDIVSLSLSTDQVKKANQLCALHLKGKPVQYILGEWDFRNLNLEMEPPVFIPRPETEELVGHILSYSSTLPPPITQGSRNFLEIGCGSGAICISLLQELSPPEQWQATAIDKLPAAVELTLRNAAKNGIPPNKLSVKEMPFNSLTLLSELSSKKFDFIVSNPPYISSRDMSSLPKQIIDHEFSGALCGGHDGLDVIRHILSRAPHLLKPHGTVWLETDSNHHEPIEQVIQESHVDLRFLRSIKDFNGLDRFCCLSLKS